MGAVGGPSLPGATEQLQPQFVSRFLEGQSGVTIKHVSCGDLFTACLTGELGLLAQSLRLPVWRECPGSPRIALGWAGTQAASAPAALVVLSRRKAGSETPLEWALAAREARPPARGGVCGAEPSPQPSGRPVCTSAGDRGSKGQARNGQTLQGWVCATSPCVSCLPSAQGVPLCV